MAYATEYRTSHTGFISDRVNAIMARVRIARAKRRAYDQTMDELSNLSQRDLDDLDISASDIPFIAREAADMVK